MLLLLLFLFVVIIIIMGQFYKPIYLFSAGRSQMVLGICSKVLLQGTVVRCWFTCRPISSGSSCIKIQFSGWLNKYCFLRAHEALACPCMSTVCDNINGSVLQQTCFVLCFWIYQYHYLKADTIHFKEEQQRLQRVEVTDKPASM